MHLTAANCYAAAGQWHVGELCRPMHVHVRIRVYVMLAAACH